MTEKRSNLKLISCNHFLDNISVEYVVCFRERLVKTAHSIVNSSVVKSKFTANVSQPRSRVRFLLEVQQNLIIP